MLISEIRRALYDSSMNNDIFLDLITAKSIERFVSDDDTDVFVFPAEGTKSVGYSIEVQNLSNVFRRKAFLLVRNECINLEY